MMDMKMVKWNPNMGNIWYRYDTQTVHESLRSALFVTRMPSASLITSPEFAQRLTVAELEILFIIIIIINM